MLSNYTEKSNMRRFSGTVISISGIIGIMAILKFLRLPTDTYLWREIHNTGHTPLFGLLALFYLVLLSIYARFENPARYKYYIAAFICTVVTGALVEFIQYFGPGDADIVDLVRDTLGAVIFLGLYSVFDRRLYVAIKNSRRAKALVVVGSLLVLVISLIPLGLWVGAYFYRDNAFPEIANFESFWGNRFVMTREAGLSLVKPPSAWKTNKTERCAKLTLLPGSGYPTLSIEEPFPDWRGYEYLDFEMYSESDTTVKMAVRIEDFAHNGQYNDRFNSKLRVIPGANRFSIPLYRIRNAPSTRRMNMSRIRAIHFFAFGLKSNLIVYIDKVRLE